MTTLLCQIEACINSSLLTPMSSDPSDIYALNPGQFLIGSSLLDLPESKNSQPKLPLSLCWLATQDQRSSSGRDGPESTCIIYSTDQNELNRKENSKVTT
ncbi:hypothetical protein AVEN_109998-1 [Araneus ventricosus]|uniref:Uncharacterized protein n=1 Tax=Araneus ventricosus TaxID=182803 RepID=A0A4Y2VEV9_ARAVE|nr:hypothetical protein AVEN_109998-1 [Araneus ventricosus]